MPKQFPEKIFVTREEEKDGSEPICRSAHLTVGQVKQLIAGLNKFLNDVEEAR